ncbi:hypothetical protein NDA13_002041 [Ustilago tritici]|nr:hypothetical protein NDA13_002041 [Ustilago tritici]
MAGKFFESEQEHQAIASFHGIPSSSRAHGERTQPRRRTRIDIPKPGSTPYDTSPPRQATCDKSQRRSARKSSHLPTRELDFRNNLHEEPGNRGIGGVFLGTARRSTYLSSAKSTPSPKPPSPQLQRGTPSDGVTIELVGPANSVTGSGKGKARDMIASQSRATRSTSHRRASQKEQEVISVTDSDDDPVEADFSIESNQIIQPRKSRRQSGSRAQQPVRLESALEAKDRRRREEAEASSAADPNRFYSRSTQKLVSGPVPLEQPDDEFRKSASGRSVLVHSSESPEQEVRHHSLGDSSRKVSAAGLVSRMKPKASSPNAPAGSQEHSPNGVASRSPQPPASSSETEKRRSSSSSYFPETNGTAQTLKRKRTDTTYRSSNRRAPTEPFLPIEVRLQAIVISDIWRSRDDARPVALFQQHSLHLRQHSETRLQIPYSDIRRVEASNETVQTHGILSLTLRPESQSARRLQEAFSDFDPRASGDASAIHFIARDEDVDLGAHKMAVSWIHQKLNGPHLGHVDFHWLVQSAAKIKVGIVAGIKQLPWPQPSQSPRLSATHQPLSSRMPALQQSSSSRLIEPATASTPAPDKSRRTLILPGQGRNPVGEQCQTARPSSASGPQRQQKKTFDIQPASPRSAAGVTVDVEMADARPGSRTPPLPGLTVTKSRPAATTSALAKAKPSHGLNLAPHTPILQYPYEGIGAVTVLVSDLERLMDGELLNDTVIEFGLKFIHENIQHRDPDLADSIYMFNTFFYKLLSATTVENSYRKLRKWTTKVDLFSKKYIVVPINEDYHWYLALIVNPHFMLMEQDGENDSASEQDKEEVASALTTAPKASPPLSTVPIATSSASPAATAREDNPATVEDANSKRHREARTAPSSEPGTPPLPQLQLPLRSSQPDRGSTADSMDVDAAPAGVGPAEGAPAPVNLKRTFVITFDSLGSRHVKVRNKLHEYLWREAIDKKRLSLDDLTKRKAKQEVEQAAKREAEKPQTRAKEAAQDDRNGDAAHSPMDETTDGPNDVETADESKELGDDGISVRKIQVQDTRQLDADGDAKQIGEETLAKSLPMTAYIHAQVPTQPNFCDCGIYLLHYVERFFDDPDKFLKLVVTAAEKRIAVGKQGSAIRQKLREEAEKSFESEWQAGEVSGKREWWRRRVIDLREGWMSYQDSKKAAEKDDKKNGKEQTASGQSSQVIESGSQQKHNTQHSDADVVLPPAETPAGAIEESEKRIEGRKEADDNQQHDEDAQAQSLDLQLPLLPISTQGSELGRSTSVDNVVAFAEALTGKVDAEMRKRILQAQREVEEQMQASEVGKPVSQWLHRLMPPSNHSTTANLPIADHDIALQPTPSGSQLPLAPLGQREEMPGPPTNTSSSNASPRRDQPQQQQHRASPSPPPSFGSSMQGPSTGTSGSTAELREMLKPTETFGSGILHPTHHRKPHDSVDVSSNSDSSDGGESNSSADVVDIVGPSPSLSSSVAANQG